jgi:hypothetical protein
VRLSKIKGKDNKLTSKENTRGCINQLRALSKRNRLRLRRIKNFMRKGGNIMKSST